MIDDAPLPLDEPLSQQEARVLGCLIEKEATTPETYPLTENAARTAANQKTSRHPQMNLSEGEVGQALRRLETRGLVKSEYGARASRYAHRVESGLKLTREQKALLGLMLLRGPQTLAELFSRSSRLHRFDELEDVDYALERLCSGEAPMAVRIPKGPGQREDRYMHRLCGPVAADAGRAAPGADSRPAEASGAPSADADLIARLEALEARVADLESKLDD
ncbi:DUF480 domain-containing protein [Halomonas denitrificans]|nr:DUF480 domain-containing protein [Halomonas denitrificans]